MFIKKDNTYNDDFDFEEQLIQDSATALNLNRAKKVYCFTKHQAEEVQKRCYFECSLEYNEEDKVFIVKRIKSYKEGKDELRKKNAVSL